MIVNPSWHVPTSIAQKDILPKLKKNPRYLEKHSMIIVGNGDDPHGRAIDWKSIADDQFPYTLRQAPGDQNSLGFLKFEFNNPFAVYMHDTPHDELFDKDQRNFSSGCIRLRDPLRVGEIVMASSPGEWNEGKIEKAIDAKKTRWVKVAHPMPIYVLYWSVFADESGAIHFRNDAYAYDGLRTATRMQTPAN